MHYQTAFMRCTDDLAGETALTRRFALRGREHVDDEDAVAAEWAERAARAANARSRNPALSRQDVFRAFATQSGTTRARVTGALARPGS